MEIPDENMKTLALSFSAAVIHIGRKNMVGKYSNKETKLGYKS